MSRAGGSEFQLDPAAEQALADVISEFRDMLISKASFRATGRIRAEDIEHAYKACALPDPELGDAQRIVSIVLRENRVIEWVAYCMAALLFFFGLLLLGVGVFSTDAPYRVASIIGGSVTELLLLIPLRFAINARRHNIAIRMLGILLDRVDDRKKLAALLADTFQVIVIGKPPPTVI